MECATFIFMTPKGFYLYAVRSKNHKAAFPEIKGIDKRGRVSAIRVGDRIEAIVSPVALKDFSIKEVRERAQNDLKWIKEKSLLHNRVIMSGMEGSEGAIVPMKFGSIFKTKQSLSKAIKRDSEKFLELFQKLKGKEEWSLKVFAGADALKDEIIQSDRALSSKKKEIASLPAGLAYFKEKELEDTVEKRKEGEFQKWTQEIVKILPRFADEAKLGKILGKELTGKREPMILNAIFLIHTKKLNKFLKEVEKWSGMLKGKGLFMEASGPWPPYSFT